MANCINIFLKRDCIILKIKDNSSREEIIDNLRLRLPELRRFYKEEKTPILITGKVLKSAEIDEIQYMIEKAIKVKVSFDTPRTMGLHGIKKDFRKEIASSETKFYKASLRSGQKIEFEGSVVIIGDVNDGAEVLELLILLRLELVQLLKSVLEKRLICKHIHLLLLMKEMKLNLVNLIKVFITLDKIQCYFFCLYFMETQTFCL